jgi:Zn-dependent protease
MDLTETLMDRLVWMVPLILSITVHEWAHAASANWLGDDTARLLGRNTLNPMAHVDPVGTLLLPLVGVPFGWAKPVPINPIRFRRGVNMKIGVLVVAVAGPISNVCLAAACWALSSGAAGRLSVATEQGINTMIMLNCGLAVFNMLPIPPLDGSRIADALMPARFRSAWNQFGNYGFALLIAMFLLPLFLGGVNLVQTLFGVSR